MGKEIVVNAMYDFCYDNIIYGNIESRGVGSSRDMIYFKDRKQLELFLRDNSFKLHTLPNKVVLITTEPVDARIYGKVESGL